MKYNQLKLGTALSYISLILSNIISIIYTPIMLRLLGQSEYGLYNLVSSVVAYLGLLNFGFGSAYIRYYLRFKTKNDKKNIAKINGIFLILFLLIGVISLFAGTILIFNVKLVFGTELSIQELFTAQKLLIVLIINMAISFPNIVFNSYIIANEQFLFQKIIQALKIISSPFLTLPALLLGYGSVGMVVVTTILTLIIGIVNIFYCFKKLNMQFYFRDFDLSLIKEMTIFSSFIFMNMVIDQINWNLDKFLLGRFQGTVSVAVYGLAAQLNTYYQSLSSTVSQMFIPRVNTIVSTTNDNNILTKLFTKIGRIQFIILSLVCTGLIFFGKPFISLWAGVNYEDTYYIALLLIIPISIPLIQNIGIEIQQAKNMHRFRSWVYLFIAFGNLLLSLPLAKKYGGIGAASGTALSLLVGNGIIMNWYYHSRVGLNMLEFWRSIIQFLPALIIPIITGIGIMNVIDLYNFSNFLLFGVVYVLIFILSMWNLGMNKYEKELISSPISKLMRKNI